MSIEVDRASIHRFVVDTLAKSHKNFEAIMSNQFPDLERADEILA
jgi:hypothetical protein